VFVTGLTDHVRVCTIVSTQPGGSTLSRCSHIRMEAKRKALEGIVSMPALAQWTSE
jgi:hypothetical protein